MKNTQFWEQEGATKTFTHEIDKSWINPVNKTGKVLDFGCGYGRVTQHLFQLGFEDIIGYDTSISMLKRAHIENPGPNYISTIKELDETEFDLIICFALFTSCPLDAEQTELLQCINSYSKKGTLIYLSDYLIDDNPHYLKRYSEQQCGIYGCFGSEEAAIFRHHSSDHFDRLFSGWKKCETRKVEGKTLNGNPIVITQIIFEKLD